MSVPVVTGYVVPLLIIPIGTFSVSVLLLPVRIVPSMAMLPAAELIVISPLLAVRFPSVIPSESSIVIVPEVLFESA